MAGTLSINDVSLTPDGGSRLAVVQSEPCLPLELAPGTTQTLTFPHPSTALATLRILSVEYDLEDY